METPSEIGKPKEDAPDGRQVFGPIAETLVDDELTDKNLMETLVAAFENTKHLVRGRGREITKKVKEMNGDILRAIGKKVLSDKAEEARPLTKRLRAELATLAERYRKTNGDAVVENLLAWARGANVEGLAEWLDKTGWALMEADTEHADKVEAALVEAWNNLAHAAFQDCAVFRDNKRWVAGFIGKRRKDTPPAGEKLEDFLPAEMDGTEKLMAKLFCAVLDDETFSVLLGLDAARALFHSNTWSVLLATMQEGAPCKWIRLLAVPWIREQAAEVAERLDRQKTAAALEDAPRVKVKGRDFRRVPKVLAGVSWAFGGSGVELSRVTVDGKEYAPAPDLAVQNPSALVPASYALLPEDHAKKAHQTLLPIDLQGGQDAPPLPVALAGATQYALAPAAGKLGLLVMAAAWAVKGKLHKTTLRDLTRAINPDAAKLVTSHFETVTRGLVQLDGLRLVLPNGMSYRVYECPIPWRELKPEEYDAPLFIGMTRTFEKTLAAISDMAGASYRGDFLFDLTGAMMLPTKRSGLLRQYIRSCAFWNSYWKPGTAGEPDPSRVPEVSAERWAAMTNYLPPAAVEYLRANGKDRFRLSHSIRDTIKDAEALAEAGLVKIAKANRQGVRLLPPPEYLEAWHESRKGAARMPGNAGGVK